MAEGRNVTAEVKRIIKEQLDVDEKDIKPEATFIDDLGADSLGLVELVLAFEEAFEIDIPDEDTEKIRTVQDAVDYIEKHLKQAERPHCPSGAASPGGGRPVSHAQARPRRDAHRALGALKDRPMERVVSHRYRSGHAERRRQPTTPGSRSSTGKSGVGPITLFDANEHLSHAASPAEVKNFDAAEFMERKKIKEVARFITFAMASTKIALEQADLRLTDEERERAGVFIGVGLGGLENLERCTLTLDAQGPRQGQPLFHPSLIANMAAGQVSIAFGLQGPSLCNTSACSSSAHAIGEALRWLQTRPGRRDGRGRRRSHDLAHRHRRLQRDVRAQPAQRRAGAREPPLGQGPRRLRLRRGRRHARARDADASEEARRPHLGRAGRLRCYGGRLPHHEARPERRWRRSGRCASPCETRSSRPIRSTTSTRTAPPLRRVTSKRPRPWATCSARTPSTRSSG